MTAWTPCYAQPEPIRVTGHPNITKQPRMRESDLSRTIQIALSQAGHRIWRFNTGLFYTADGRPVRAGMKSASDLIGIAKGGRFVAIEVKLPGGKPTAAQQRFLDLIESMGGVSGCARSVDEALAIVEEH